VVCDLCLAAEITPSQRRDHFSKASRCRDAQAVYPRAIHPGRVPGVSPHPRTLRDLSRGGVCRALAVTSKAVVSYTTFSPLPDPHASFRPPAAIGGMFSVALSLCYPSAKIACGRVGVTHHRAMPCSDFPLRAARRWETHQPLFRSDRVRIAVALDLSAWQFSTPAARRQAKMQQARMVKLTKRACCVGSGGCRTGH